MILYRRCFLLRPSGGATVDNEAYYFIDQPRRRRKKTEHTFRHNQLILIAWKLLFIYGIENKELVETGVERRELRGRVMIFLLLFLFRDDDKRAGEGKKKN